LNEAIEMFNIQRSTLVQFNTQPFKHAESGCCPLFVPSPVFFLLSHLCAGSMLTFHYTAGMFFRFLFHFFFANFPFCSWVIALYLLAEGHMATLSLEGPQAPLPTATMAQCVARQACRHWHAPHGCMHRWHHMQHSNHNHNTMQFDDSACDTTHSTITATTTPNTAWWHHSRHQMQHNDTIHNTMHSMITMIATAKRSAITTIVTNVALHGSDL
jgi:hypothetical protein